MVELVNLERFLELRKRLIIVDVRSPVEYDHAHIPDSVNIPLFSDDQRARIGWTYKHKGQEEAITLGESFAEPKIPSYLSQAENYAQDKEILVLCARGGLRSQRFSQLLDESGFRVYRLEPGYKGYRRKAQTTFGEKHPLVVLGGKTGCGKTEILAELSERGELVLDLEALAHHRGSAFGALGMGSQPSTEQFENCLFEELMNFTAPQRIWVEDESLNIGRIFLPVPFYDLMKSSSLVLVEMDMKYRLDRLNRDYGQESLILLEETILKIQKRLGIENAHKAVSALHRGDIREATSIVLGYYDKSYEYDRIQKNRNLLCRIFSDDGDPVAIAAAILDQMDKR